MSVADDVFIAKRCGWCDNPIDQGTDYAGEIVWRFDQTVPLHSGCVEEYDENEECQDCFHPLRIHESKYGCSDDRDRNITGDDGHNYTVACKCSCERDEHGDTIDILGNSLRDLKATMERLRVSGKVA